MLMERKRRSDEERMMEEERRLKREEKERRTSKGRGRIESWRPAMQTNEETSSGSGKEIRTTPEEKTPTARDWLRSRALRREGRHVRRKEDGSSGDNPIFITRPSAAVQESQGVQEYPDLPDGPYVPRAPARRSGGGG